MALAFAIALAAAAFGLAIALAMRSARREMRSTSAEATGQAQTGHQSPRARCIQLSTRERRSVRWRSDSGWLSGCRRVSTCDDRLAKPGNRPESTSAAIWLRRGRVHRLSVFNRDGAPCFS